MYAQTQAYHLRLNVYPGVLRVGSWSPGVFVALDRRDKIVAGVMLHGAIPCGIAYDGN
jgi:hypothetical protein